MMKKFLIRNAVCACLSLLPPLLPAGSFAASDNVLSANIKEADGTSGQNTDAGSGVKTGHIQDAAVTTPKLASESVATDKIAAGAVTDAKISGTIATSKLNVGTTAGTVAAGDHAHDGIYERKYANVKVVSLDGNGDFTSPVDAVNSITDASETNPYLVKIMPGVYDFGSSRIITSPFVDIQGSGRHITRLVGSGISLAANSHVSELTVTAQYSAPQIGIQASDQNSIVNVDVFSKNVALSVEPNAKVVVDGATLTVDGTGGGNNTSMGIWINGYLGYGWLTIRNTTIDVSNGENVTTGISSLGVITIENSTVKVYGVYPEYTTGIGASDGVIKNVSVSTNGVALSGNYDWTVHQSILNGDVAAYSHWYAGSVLNIANTQIIGPITTPGTVHCFGTYGEDFQPVTCP